jgi:uridine kinase
MSLASLNAIHKNNNIEFESVEVLDVAYFLVPLSQFAYFSKISSSIYEIQTEVRNGPSPVHHKVRLSTRRVSQCTCGVSLY